MAVNKRKILEAARKLAQKGAKDKALKEYQRLLKLDPKDAKLRLEIGDSYRRWGQVDEAVEAYVNVADHYMKEGFDARAVAVFKQILNLDPDRFDAYEPLAELYQRMGLTAEAINALQTAADGYHRQGDKKAALTLLRKMATIDPSNTTSRIKIADLLRHENLLEEAVAEYDEAASELERQGESETVATVLERILEIQPKRVITLERLARNLIGRGLAERAEPFAKRALELEPGTPGNYETLAEVYRSQQRNDALAGVYRQLADLFRERGDEDRARDIMQRLMPASELGVGEEGFDELSQRAAFDEHNLGGDVSDALHDGFLSDESVIVQPEASTIIYEDASGDDSTRSRGLRRGAFADSRRVPEGDPEQLLAEASVYLRYGKSEQAIENLESILAGDPDYRPALEKLGEAYAAAGHSGDAVSHWLRAANLALGAGDAAGLEVLRGRIAALDPAAADSLGEAAEISLEIEEPVPSDGPTREAPAYDASHDLAPESEFDLDDIEVDLESAEFADEADLALPPSADDTAPDPLEYAPASDSPDFSNPSTSSSMSQQISEDLEEADFYVQQGLLGEAEGIYQRVLTMAPNHPHAMARLGEIAAQRGEDPNVTPVEAPAAAAAVPAEEGSEELIEWDDDAPAEEPVAATSEPLELEFAPEALDDRTDPPHEDDEDDTDDEVEVDLDLEPELEDELEDDFGEHEPEADLKRHEQSPGLEQGGQHEILAQGEGDDLEADARDADLERDEPDDELEPEAPADEPAIVAPTPEVAPPAIVAPTPEVAPPVAASAPDSGFDLTEPGFDLAAELSDAFDGDANALSSGNLTGTTEDGFAAVFADFKKGVSQQLSEGDSEAHYDLGIAYREMGLIEDAVGEFELASASPDRRIDCLHMLGLCALDQGLPGEAVGHLQQALESADRTAEQSLALQFGLGCAFEAVGDLQRARESWEAVAALDPSFCEVEDRLGSLGQGERKDLAEETIQDIGGGFESFDDLFDEGAEDDEAGTGAEASAEPEDDEPEPKEPEPGIPESQAVAEPDPPQRSRRKKKISFV